MHTNCFDMKLFTCECISSFIYFSLYCSLIFAVRPPRDKYGPLWNPNATPEEIRATQGRNTRLFIDPSIDPCKDFYRYSCGNWKKYNKNPNSDQHSTYSELRLRFEMKKLLKQGSTTMENIDYSDAEKKLKTYYTSCLNQKEIKKQGIQPVVDFLHKFKGWPLSESSLLADQYDWLNLTANLNLFGYDFILSEEVKAHEDNDFHFTTILGAGNLILGNKSIYLQDSSISRNRLRLLYRVLVKSTLQIYKIDLKNLNNKFADNILDFEIELAKITPDPDTDYEDEDELINSYYTYTLEELQEEANNMNWKQYLTTIQNSYSMRSKRVIAVEGTDFLTNLSSIVSRTDEATIRNYILFSLAVELVYLLDRALWSKVHKMIRSEDYNERSDNCFDDLEENMEKALHAFFVRSFISENDMTDSQKLADDIIFEYIKQFNETDFFDDNSKQSAIEKANKLSAHIGYESTILSHRKLNREYKSLSFEPTKFFENFIQVRAFKQNQDQKKLGKYEKPYFSPYEINAYYDPNVNEIFLPAGIMKPPFYQEHFQKWAKYGGYGTVVGHEIGHAFDSGSVQSDFEEGKYDEKFIFQYMRQSMCLARKYDKYEFENIVEKVDTIGTMGENIADILGLILPYKAYKNWLNENEDMRKFELIPELNLTETQLYFVSYAQVSCSYMPDEDLVESLTDEHSPDILRVHGPVMNIPEFSEEFKCPVGSPMNPERKCKFAR